ncbi:formimidoylglutamate deiminase, partial [Listeria monocytogenes]
MSTWFFPSALGAGRIAHNARGHSQNSGLTDSPKRVRPAPTTCGWVSG